MIPYLLSTQAPSIPRTGFISLTFTVCLLWLCRTVLGGGKDWCIHTSSHASVHETYLPRSTSLDISETIHRPIRSSCHPHHISLSVTIAQNRPSTNTTSEMPTHVKPYCSPQPWCNRLALSAGVRRKGIPAIHELQDKGEDWDII